MITYIDGDIFKGKEDILVHGCNCMCVMGAGVARQIAKYYPLAYNADKQTIRGDKLKLGSYTSWSGPHTLYDQNITIVNLYSQYIPAAYLKPFDPNAFAIGMSKIKRDFSDKTIAMPKIGAGLAGGDWIEIESMLNDIFLDKHIVVYVYDPIL